MRRSLAFVGAVAAAAVLAAGCKADMVVHVDVAHDGTGSVTVDVLFDHRVLRWAPDLGEQILSDGAQGWAISHETEPGLTGDGLRVTATKRFGSPEELNAVLAEIDQPPDGGVPLFGPATLTARREGAQILYDLKVPVNLNRPVTEFVNPATADHLAGELFGVPISEIESRGGAPLNELVTLVVRGTVPLGAERLPADGVMGLDDGGTYDLRVTGELLDPEVYAAEAEAERLSSRASRGLRIALVWWLLLGIAMYVTTLVLTRGWRRRRMVRKIGLELEAGQTPLPLPPGPPGSVPTVPGLGPRPAASAAEKTGQPGSGESGSGQSDSGSPDSGPSSPSVPPASPAPPRVGPPRPRPPRRRPLRTDSPAPANRPAPPSPPPPASRPGADPSSPPAEPPDSGDGNSPVVPYPRRV